MRDVIVPEQRHVHLFFKSPFFILSCYLLLLLHMPDIFLCIFSDFRNECCASEICGMPRSVLSLSSTFPSAVPAGGVHLTSLLSCSFQHDKIRGMCASASGRTDFHGLFL